MAVIIQIKEFFGFEVREEDQISYEHNYGTENMVDVVVTDRSTNRRYVFDRYDVGKQCFA